jgi:hypothetical protein
MSDPYARAKVSGKVLRNYWNLRNALITYEKSLL